MNLGSISFLGEYSAVELDWSDLHLKIDTTLIIFLCQMVLAHLPHWRADRPPQKGRLGVMVTPSPH